MHLREKKYIFLSLEFEWKFVPLAHTLCVNWMYDIFKTILYKLIKATRVVMKVQLYI